MQPNYPYRALFDCDNTEAAKDFVRSLYLLLFNTPEAILSIFAPVWCEVPDWLSTEPANVFWTCDEPLSVRIEEAIEANLGELFLLLVMI